MKKGFTLIELLAVIMVLGIIVVIAVPTVNKVIKNTKESSASINEKMILDSAENWNYANSKNLKTTGINTVYVKQLINDGFLKMKSSDTNDKLMDKCVSISYVSSDGSYNYELKIVM